MRLTFLGLSCLCVVWAQPATPPGAEFEVASIRASEGGKGGENPFRQNIQVSPGTLTMRGISLKSAIRWAYHVMDYQVTGPGWLVTERFDIVAKAPGPATEDELRPMLQKLLASRFHVAVHHESKELSAFILSVAKNGPKFKESQSEGDSSVEPDQKTMTVVVHRTAISQLVEVLSNILRAPVLDETGLKGRYDVTIDAGKYIPSTPEDRAAMMDPLAIISNGLQGELGLKLESRKAVVDLVVVDHAEKLPTEN